MASAQDQWLVALGVPAEIFLLVGGKGANGGGAQPDGQKSGPDATPPTSTGSAGPDDANQAKLKTNLPRTQARPGTGNPNAVRASNAEDPNAQRPTYSEDREQALRQGMVARANAHSTAQPAPAPVVDYTRGLVPPPSYLARDAPEMLEVWEKIKTGDKQARETWISVMGTPESQGKNKAALEQAKADVQKAKQQAATDSKIGAALSAVSPVAGKIYEKIGGLETVKELGKTDWKKEWNDTALAIGDQVQKRVDSLAEEIVALPDQVHDAVKKLEKSVDAVAEELVALPDQVNHALDTLKKATSGWDLDQVKGTLGTLAGQAYDDAKKALDEGKKQLAEAKKRLAGAEGKIAKQVGNAVSDPKAAVKQLMQAATDKYNEVERKLQKAEKDFWRANPEKMREKLADLTVEAASQAGQAALMEGGGQLLGKGLKVVRGVENVEEGAAAAREVNTLGKAGEELEAAGTKTPHRPGTPKVEAPRIEPKSPVERAEPGARGVVSGPEPATETQGLGGEKRVVHDSKLPPSGDTVTKAGDAAPTSGTTTSVSDALGGNPPDGSSGVRGGKQTAPQPPPGTTRTASSTQLDTQSAGAGTEKSVVHHTEAEPSGNTVTTTSADGPRTQTAAGDVKPIGRAPIDPHEADVPKYAMAGGEPPETPGEKLHQPSKGSAGGSGEPKPSKPVDHPAAKPAPDTPAVEKTPGRGEAPRPDPGGATSPGDDMGKLIDDAMKSVEKEDSAAPTSPTKPARAGSAKPAPAASRLKMAAKQQIDSIPKNRGRAFVFDPASKEIAVGDTIHQQLAEQLGSSGLNTSAGFLKLTEDGAIRIVPSDSPYNVGGREMLSHVAAHLRAMGYRVAF